MPIQKLTAFALLLATACHAQTEEKPGRQEKQEPSASEKMMAQFQKTLEKQKIRLDTKKRTVTVDVVVNRPTNDLEFLLIHPQGKSHEALLICEAKPSVLNSALLYVCGGKKGRNASFKKKDPAPTQAELEKGADPYELVAPTGPALFLTVSYKGKDGKQVDMPIEELLLDWTANLTVTGNQWIFLGGRMAQLYRDEPPVFVADFEGNLVSCCYKHPANHLVTLEHGRAGDEMNWAIGPLCPPPGTKMQLTFHTTKPKVVAEREVRVAKEAEERKRKGEGIDLTTRPDRNPARPGMTPPPKPKPDSRPTSRPGDGK